MHRTHGRKKVITGASHRTLPVRSLVRRPVEQAFRSRAGSGKITRKKEQSKGRQRKRTENGDS